MFDINRHKFFLVQILKDIYTDVELANYLGFKGDTALMFFYDLPRFSVDLDFDLLNADKEHLVFNKVRKIILKYGTIFDEAKKYFGPLIVLDYGIGERKLKIEMSNRQFNNSYEIKNLLGFNVIENCINLIETMKGKRLLDGLGELMDADMKNFVKTKLLIETINLLKFYQKFPILSG